MFHPFLFIKPRKQIVFEGIYIGLSLYVDEATNIGYVIPRVFNVLSSWCLHIHINSDSLVASLVHDFQLSGAFGYPIDVYFVLGIRGFLLVGHYQFGINDVGLVVLEFILSTAHLNIHASCRIDEHVH